MEWRVRVWDGSWTQYVVYTVRIENAEEIYRMIFARKATLEERFMRIGARNSDAMIRR